MSDGDEESFELYTLAASILEDCRQAGQLSDLSTIILLFREALTHRSGSHPLRFQSTCSLATALLIQSSRTNKLQDLDEAILLLKEVSGFNPEITRDTLEEQDRHGMGSDQVRKPVLGPYVRTRKRSLHRAMIYPSVTSPLLFPTMNQR